MSAVARIESSAAAVTSTAGEATVGAAAGAGLPFAGFGDASIWVGSSPAVSASVSDGGQFGRAQLGPETVASSAWK